MSQQHPAVELENKRYDPRVTYYLCLATAATTFPFVLYHGFGGRWYLAGVTSLLVGMVLVVAFELYRGKEATYERIRAVAYCGNVVAVVAISSLQHLGMFWSFPVLIFNYYLLRTRDAFVVNGLTVVALGLLSLPWIEPALLLRQTAAWALLMAFSFLFARQITTQNLKLNLLAHTDALTGAGNRLAMQADLRQVFDEAAHADGNDAERTLPTLIIMDLDHFKDINDTYGHDVGDRALTALVQVLRANLRNSDKIYRFGGEEFVVLTQGLDMARSLQHAERLRQVVANADMDGINSLTISAGVSQLSDDDTVESWLKRGDQALYQAKVSGRNRVEPVLASA